MKTTEAVPVRTLAVGGESFFAQYAPLKMAVQRSGDRVLVYATNQGKNILLLKRMILRLGWPSGGATYLYLRPEDYYLGGERIEQGWMHLKYQSGSTSAVDAQVSVEYMEVTGRSESPYVTF